MSEPNAEDGLMVDIVRCCPHAPGCCKIRPAIRVSFLRALVCRAFAWQTHEYIHDPAEFERTAREHTQRHATSQDAKATLSEVPPASASAPSTAAMVDTVHGGVLETATLAAASDATGPNTDDSKRQRVA